MIPDNPSTKCAGCKHQRAKHNGSHVKGSRTACQQCWGCRKFIDPANTRKANTTKKKTHPAKSYNLSNAVVVNFNDKAVSRLETQVAKLRSSLLKLNHVALQAQQQTAKHLLAGLQPATTPQVEPSGEPEETRMFPGKLIGYRHFQAVTSDRLTASFQDYIRGPHIASPTHSFDWVDGENTAGCATLTRTASEMRETLADLEHRREVYIAGIETFFGSGRFDYYFEGTNTKEAVYNDKTVAWYTEEIQKIENYIREREKLDRGEHSLKPCRCGFYVSYSPQTNFYSGDYMLQVPMVHAVVETWGRIVLGTKGFRASKLHVVALAPETCEGVMAYDFLRDTYYESPGIGRRLLPEIREAASSTFPSARWYDTKEEMHAAHPEPDRTGLPVDRSHAHPPSQGDYL